MKRTALPNGKERLQFNVRVAAPLRQKMDHEIQRQGRKRDVLVERVFEYFLSLKPSERESICAKAA